MYYDLVIVLEKLPTHFPTLTSESLMVGRMLSNKENKITE